MSEMSERIAHAIFNSGFHSSDVADGTADKKWDEWTEDVARARRSAAMVLIAMREPTEEMQTAEPDGGYDIYWGYLADGRPWLQEDVWRAMIDAALAKDVSQ